MDLVTFAGVRGRASVAFDLAGDHGSWVDFDLTVVAVVDTCVESTRVCGTSKRRELNISEVFDMLCLNACWHSRAQLVQR